VIALASLTAPEQHTPVATAVNILATQTDSPASEEALTNLLVIGSSVTFDDASRLTLYEVKYPVEMTSDDKTDPRKSYVAVEVEQCASSTMPAEKTLFVNALFFQIVMTNRRWHAPILTGIEPEISVADLGPAECTRGWITFRVPRGSSLDRIVFSGFGYDQTVLKARWDLGLVTVP